MAQRKKKKEESGGGCGIILVIILLAILLWLFVVLLASAPILITGAIVFYYYMLFRKKEKYRIATNLSFWLDELEKDKFAELKSNIDVAYQKIYEAEELIESENLSKNKDGSLSSKSNRGKELNMIIWNNNDYIESNKVRLDFLRYKPINNWEELEERWFDMEKTRTTLTAFKLTLIFWAVVFLIVYFYYYDFAHQDSILLSIKYIYITYFAFFQNIFSSILDYKHFLDSDWLKKFALILLVVTGISAVFFFIYRYILRISISRAKLESIHSKPEVVTLENLNKIGNG